MCIHTPSALSTTMLLPFKCVRKQAPRSVSCTGSFGGSSQAEIGPQCLCSEFSALEMKRSLLQLMALMPRVLTSFWGQREQRYEQRAGARETPYAAHPSAVGLPAIHPRLLLCPLIPSESSMLHSLTGGSDGLLFNSSFTFIAKAVNTAGPSQEV